MLDKLATYQAATEAGVATPKYWRVQSEHDVRSLQQDLVFPLIVKPRLSHEFQRQFATKFLVADNFADLLERYRTVEANGIDVLLVEKECRVRYEWMRLLDLRD